MTPEICLLLLLLSLLLSNYHSQYDKQSRRRFVKYTYQSKSEVVFGSFTYEYNKSKMYTLYTSYLRPNISSDGRRSLTRPPWSGTTFVFLVGSRGTRLLFYDSVVQLGQVPLFQNVLWTEFPSLDPIFQMIGISVLRTRMNDNSL